MKNKQEWLKKRKAKIESMYNSSMTQEEIGKQLGVHQWTISNFMKKHGIKARVASKRDQRGVKNHTWKGDKISYKGAHNRVRSVRGVPKKCVKCNTTEGKLEWASMSKQHYDPNDYQAMCIPCHRKHDMDLRTAKIKKHCPICSKEWFVIPSRSKQVHCSPQCSGKSKEAKLDSKQIIKLYQSGNSQRQVAEKYNISQTTIGRILKKHNISRISIAPVHKVFHKINPEEIRDLYNKGMNQTSVGRLLNLSPSSISNIMKFYNIPVRNTGTKEFYHA